MEEVKIELTQAEIDTKVKEETDKAVQQALAEVKKQHDSEMAQLRISAKTDKDNAIKKAVEESKLTAEELARKQMEEQMKVEHAELEQLRAEKKMNERGSMLEKEGLPKFLQNDSRLINASDDDVANVVATIKAEWEGAIPKKSGSTVSTNVKGEGDTKAQENAELERIRNLGLSR